MYANLSPYYWLVSIQLLAQPIGSDGTLWQGVWSSYHPEAEITYNDIEEQQHTIYKEDDDHDGDGGDADDGGDAAERW